MSIVSLVVNAGIVVKLVLLLLLGFSMVSWMVIFQRAVSLRRADRGFREFEATFWSGIDVRQLEERLGDSHEGVAAVFQAGMASFRRLRSGIVKESRVVTPKQASAVLVDVERSMRIAVAEEEGRLTRYLPVLATISSASPYIGLFGTVWGIMGSFLTLSSTTRADLSTVAPWVAEALVATAMGLFAAIPAVIAYNRFTATTERLVLGYRDFAEEFHTLLYRSLLSPRSSAAKRDQ
ncbi:protein TolQ [Carnimonas nigrificans]|uniref:protein TolQ n=1 Tax=Carnimonas nigrificans TaxID=64323 RepID=UPI0004B9B3B5|nr:protein TolQ [Carnimonas nigrificans]